jgi:phage-related protein
MVYTFTNETICPQEKPLHWVASAKKDLLAFPGEAVDDFGYALGVVQMGGMPPSAKPWKGEGPGVFEIVEDHRGDTYRVAYTVRFAKAIYVLHCFQKKSPTGIRTAKNDVDLIHERLKTAQADYEVRYGNND